MALAEIALPEICSAACGGAAVWCVAGKRLLCFDEHGNPRSDNPAPHGITQLAAAGDRLVGIVDSRVTWLDPKSGQILQQRAAGSAPELVSGGNSIWAIDRTSGLAWKVRDIGLLDAPKRVPAIANAATDGEQLWWTTQVDSRLHADKRTVELGVEPNARGAMDVCAGSVWISIANGLLRIGAWQAELGLPVSAPIGPIPFLLCVHGALVGVAHRGTTFVLDPLIDADAHVLSDDETIGRIGHVAAIGNTVWIFSSEYPLTRLIRVRR